MSKLNFFDKLSDAFSKLSRGYIIFILLFIPCFFIGIFLIPIGSISSNLFYRPLYFLVGQSFYSSFYVLLIKSCLYLVFILIVIRFIFLREIFKSENKSSAKLGYGILSICFILLIYFVGKDTVKDIQVFINGEYETTQSKLSSVYRSKGKSTHYYIRADKDIELNAYQYRQLEDIKEQYKDKNINLRNITITVNYLPNTKCVLNYQIDFKNKLLTFVMLNRSINIYESDS